MCSYSSWLFHRGKAKPCRGCRWGVPQIKNPTICVLLLGQTVCAWSEVRSFAVTITITITNTDTDTVKRVSVCLSHQMSAATCENDVAGSVRLSLSFASVDGYTIPHGYADRYVFLWWAVGDGRWAALV